jgi:hypothetical protein
VQKADAKQAAIEAAKNDAMADNKLSPKQLDTIDRARNRLSERRTRLRSRLSSNEEGTMVLSPDFGNASSHRIRQLDAFGTPSTDFASHSIGWLAAVARQHGNSIPTEKELNAALAVVDGVRPENEIEAMLAMQMFAAHEAAMEMIQRMRQATTMEAMQHYSTIATKMMRTYTTQVEALAKMRRGGNQTVRVEHVHVHAGGQAIVGAVTHPQQGGGCSQQKAEQPHGPSDPQALAFAPGSPVWSEKPGGDAVPVTQDER